MSKYNVGDMVEVILYPITVRENYQPRKEEYPRYKGVIEFVSEFWVTVLLNSNRTGKPMYRESFWKEQVYRCRGGN